MTTTSSHLTPAERIAVCTDTDTLRRTVAALNADIETAMATGTRGTQAHVGMLEMLNACSRELYIRGVAA